MGRRGGVAGAGGAGGGAAGAALDGRGGGTGRRGIVGALVGGGGVGTLGRGGGLPGGEGRPAEADGAATGGFGAAPLPGIDGGFANDGGLAGAVLPAGLSLGIPPANKPPNCGGPALPTGVVVGPLCPPPPPPPPMPPPAFDFDPSTAGALRSFVSAFLSLFPAWICFRSSLEAMVDGSEPFVQV